MAASPVLCPAPGWGFSDPARDQHSHHQKLFSHTIISMIIITMLMFVYDDHHHLSPALQHAGRWMKGSCSPLCLVRSGSQRLNNSTLQVYSSLNYWYYYSTPTSGANIYYSKLLTVGGHLCFCRLPVSTHASIDTLGFINVKTYLYIQCKRRLSPLILWFSSNLLLYCSVNNVQCLDRTDNSEVHTKTWP